MKKTLSYFSTFILLCFYMLIFISCEKSNILVSDGKVSNLGFENGLEYWQVTENVKASEVKKHNGNMSLYFDISGFNECEAKQSIENLKPGLYYLEAYTYLKNATSYCYMYGEASNGEQMTSIPVSQNSFKKVTVRGIKVGSDGKLTVGLKALGSSAFCYIDDLVLKYESNQAEIYPALFGGAISWLDWEEDMGAKYYDADKNQKDALQILRENGCNFVRLELYNNPGDYKNENGEYFPSQYKNCDAIFVLAKRAADKGFEIQLSFMYADYWGNEAIPSDWLSQIEGLSDTKQIADKLSVLLYDFTHSFMLRLKNANITPTYVSLGNEIDPGILLPYASSTTEEGVETLAKLLNSGYKAVKDVSPETKVVIHLGCNANDMFWENKKGTGTWFFNLLNENNVNYDIIGSSFYPFWAQTDNQYAVKQNLDLTDLKDWCKLMIDRFDKNILIMETGYNWGTPGQLANNGAYKDIYPSSPSGQKNYMIDMINTIKSVKDGRCVGCLYWDPILVRQPGIGYALYDNGLVRENVVETTTFFDYDHIALPILDAFKYN